MKISSATLVRFALQVCLVLMTGILTSVESSGQIIEAQSDFESPAARRIRTQLRAAGKTHLATNTTLRGFPAQTEGQAPTQAPSLVSLDAQPTPRRLDSDGITQLESFEQLAIQNHPALNAAVAKILTARHQALQAGLAPNPTLGLFLDEVGNEDDPGLWGAFLQRKIIRGNKLALGKKVKNREAGVLELKFESQVLRIKTDVRAAFYRLLIAQQKQDLAAKLYQSQQDAIAKSRELYQAGETPKTDLLQTELQAQKTMMLVIRSEAARQGAWRALASVVGKPELASRFVEGSLDPIVDRLAFDQCLNKIWTNSPELQAASAEIERVRSTIDRQVAGSIPDYQTQVTVGRDSATNHFFTGVQVQMPLQFCNRNQGNIAAAQSQLVVAQNNLETLKLDLSKRLSVEFMNYESALAQSEMYSSQLLPKAQQTLNLLVSGYPEEVSFLQLLTAQQLIIDITMQYLDSIDSLWNSRLRIEGFLLDDSLGQ
ncbi:MAG: cobalt-zinc-cadmium efflux system outer membrane protein [Mariniblastus sp.]|jgi:cobalt-zinc-cadmium efflux system outer membrane protein